MSQSYTPYHLKLVIRKGDDGHRAHWVEPDGEESDPFPLALPLTPQDLSDLSWYLESYYRSPGDRERSRAREIEARIRDWGWDLLAACFDNREGAHLYRTLRQVIDGGLPCLLTIATTDADVMVQPWEMVRDERGPLVFRGVIVRRQGCQTPGSLTHTPLSWPLRVLVIVSRPDDIGFIDPRKTSAPLLDALSDLPSNQCVVEFCDPPTLERLQARVSHVRRTGHSYDIIHFDGVGAFHLGGDANVLAFERENGTAHFITGSELGDVLSPIDVPLVVLEAGSSVASALLESGVGSVIAFSHAVHARTARLLVERFYAELVNGLTVGQALNEARGRLHTDPGRRLRLDSGTHTIDIQDWFVPQLHQADADPVLTLRRTSPSAEEVSAAVAPAYCEARYEGRTGRLRNFPPPPTYGFHGRARELLDLERALRRHSAVLLCGVEGIGKTALAREVAAWWLRTGCFETAVFCNCADTVSAEQILQVIGEALEGPQFSARSSSDQWQCIVDLFHRCRLLLVWDDLEPSEPSQRLDEAASGDVGAQLGAAGVSSSPRDANRGVSPEPKTSLDGDGRARLLQLYRDLTAGHPAGRILVTCRSTSVGLPGIRESHLSGLDRADSLRLLAAVLDSKGISTDRPGYEAEKIATLLDAVDDHPLSIELLAPHLEGLTPDEVQTEFSEIVERSIPVLAEQARPAAVSPQFSVEQLSASTRQVLPYLAWFEGGVFENLLLDFTELEPSVWTAVRAELEAAALISVEQLEHVDSPYLRFLPALRSVASSTEVPDPRAAEKRFVAVYQAAMRRTGEALQDPRSAAGTAVLAREEANFRAAVHRALQHGDWQEGVWMADILRDCLAGADRPGELDLLETWSKDQVPEASELDEAACTAICQQAWNSFAQGDTAEALQMVLYLITRLEAGAPAGQGVPSAQVAMSYRYLGRIYDRARRYEVAVDPLKKAVAVYDRIGAGHQDDLVAALGDLADAYSHLGQFEAALEASDREMDLRRELGDTRQIAASLGRRAQILTSQQCYVEADVRYGQALAAAQAAGDLGLQAALLQHRGRLQYYAGRYDQSVELCRQAIMLFKQAGDTEGEMQTYNLLAGAEVQRGNLDAAEACYARSRRLAEQRKDRAQLATIAQNVSVLHQSRAEHAPDPISRVGLLRQAVASAEESLAIKLEEHYQIGAAASYSQLGILYQMLGELNLAEENVRRSLQIRESLNLPDVYKDYRNLAQIARQRDDEENATHWQGKYEAKTAELRRLRQHGDSEGPSDGSPPQ